MARQKLGLLDQLMFKVEEGGLSPMYMGGCMILDSADSPYPVNGQIVADHLAACMEEIPLMRQRLVQDPLNLGDLRLVDDPEFNVRNHVYRTTLPAPGGHDELTAALARFSSLRMDLSKPLWHFEVFDGLAQDRIAVAMHIHHAIMDGSGSRRILGAFWSERPGPGRKPRATPWEASAAPSRLRLMRDAWLENIQRLYIQAPKFVLDNAGPAWELLNRELSKRRDAPDGTDKDPAGGKMEVHKTSLNVAPISTERTIAYLDLPLADIKSLRRRLDCSINDIALLLSSCALEHYFAGIGEPIDFDLVAAMPLDMRAADDNSPGNAVAPSRVSLHNTIRDTRKRLQAIAADTNAIKQAARPAKSAEEQAPGVDYQALGTLVSPLTLDLLVYGISRLNLLDKVTPVNVVVSNVPGPQTPVYLAGARLHSQIPMGPCFDTLALNITVSSSHEHLAFGFHACARTVRNPDLLVEGADRAYRQLKRLTQKKPQKKQPQAAARKKPRRARRSSGGS